MSRVIEHRPSRKAQKTIVATLPQVSQFFEVSVAGVEKWRRSGMPGTAGAWDLGAITAWLKVRDSKHRKGSYDQRSKRAKALLLELEYQKKRGLLIPKADHLSFVRDLATLFVNAVRRYADSLPAQVVGKDLGTTSMILRDRADEIIQNINDMALRLDAKDQAQNGKK